MPTIRNDTGRCQILNGKHVAAGAVLEVSSRYVGRVPGFTLVDATTSWADFYPPTAPDTIRFLQEHHERFFDYFQTVVPAGRVMEIGIGSGAFFIKLVELGYEVLSIELVLGVIESAHQTLEGMDMRALKDRVVLGDTFALGDYHGFAAIVHQGLFEHFTDADIRRALREQLRVARRVIFSVPSAFYPMQDVGNERLMEPYQWQHIIGADVNLAVTHIELYGGNSGKYHVLVDVCTK